MGVEYNNVIMVQRRREVWNVPGNGMYPGWAMVPDMKQKMDMREYTRASPRIELCLRWYSGKNLAPPRTTMLA